MLRCERDENAETGCGRLAEYRGGYFLAAGYWSIDTGHTGVLGGIWHAAGGCAGMALGDVAGALFAGTPGDSGRDILPEKAQVASRSHRLNRRNPSRIGDCRCHFTDKVEKRVRLNASRMPFSFFFVKGR